MWVGIGPFAILLALGPSLVVVAAIIGNAVITHRAAKKAQTAAAEAASLLLKSDIRLDNIQKTAESTHTIVNSQRTVILKVVAVLARRVANENPADIAAQIAADEAEKEAHEANNV
jgi:hypothetical protein